MPDKPKSIIRYSREALLSYNRSNKDLPRGINLAAIEHINQLANNSSSELQFAARYLFACWLEAVQTGLRDDRNHNDKEPPPTPPMISCC